jgi:signal transduction histidine kinase
LVTINDITDRKKAEMERITALTAQENVRIRDEFISIASHELKTPISALKLQTQLIERDMHRGQNLRNLGEVVALLNRQVDRLTDLVNTMLDVSRISSGRFLLDMQNLDLPALVREVISSQKFLASSVDIRFEGVPHLQVRGDRARLEQVIENILSNAVKYGEGRPVLVTLQEEQKSLAVLTVKDEGIGIPAEFIPKIFDRFERGVSARNISGLGLGLYITKQILDGHGGTIAAMSEPGKGSSFTVTLPLF